MEEIKWHTCTLSYHSGRQIWEVTCIDHNVSTLINVMLQFPCQINNGFPLKKVWTAVNWATAQQVRTKGWQILTWQIDSKIKTCENICFTCLLGEVVFIRKVCNNQLGCNEFVFRFSLGGFSHIYLFFVL